MHVTRDHSLLTSFARHHSQLEEEGEEGGGDKDEEGGDGGGGLGGAPGHILRPKRLWSCRLLADDGGGRGVEHWAGQDVHVCVH